MAESKKQKKETEHIAKTEPIKPAIDPLIKFKSDNQKIINGLDLQIMQLVTRPMCLEIIIFII